MAGTIGRCCVFNTDEEANINQAVARIRLKERSDPTFLAKYLNSYWGQLGFLKQRHDVSQPNINLAELRQIPIILPLLQQQKNILETIAPMEREARFFDENAAKVRQAVADILPDELGITAATDDIRYFFRSGEEKQSIAFAVPASAVDDRLQYLFFHPRQRALADLQNRFSCTTLAKAVAVPIRRGEQPEYEDDGEIMVLKTVDLKNGFIASDHALRVGRDFFESKPQAHIQRGDVLLASTGYGSMGKVDIYESYEEAMCDGHISILRPIANYDPYFLAYYLRSYLGQLQIEKWFSGSSGQIEIQAGDIGRIILPTPDENGVPLTEQKRIAALITTRLEEARSLEAQAAQKWLEAHEIFEKMLFAS